MNLLNSIIFISDYGAKLIAGKPALFCGTVSSQLPFCKELVQINSSIKGAS
jgi:hypothetical protein